MHAKRERRDPNQEEQTSLAEWLELGKDVMAHYGVDRSLSVYENLDNVYDAWVADESAGKPAREAVLLGLATAFGDRLCHKHGTSWQLVTDEKGTDFVLTIKGREIYPLHFVAKRIASLDTAERESGFFAGMNAVIDSW